MPNIGSILKNQNKTTLKKETDSDSRKCNCRDRTSCPLQGECLTSSVVYEATVTTNEDSHRYIGLTEGTFKTRFNGHKQSFAHERYRTSTELSNKIWELKDHEKDYQIWWRILQTANTYQCGARSCDLCLSEKLNILKNPGTLNKRSEIISKCRHSRKFLLSRVT